MDPIFIGVACAIGIGSIIKAIKDKNQQKDSIQPEQTGLQVNLKLDEQKKQQEYLEKNESRIREIIADSNCEINQMKGFICHSQVVNFLNKWRFAFDEFSKNKIPSTSALAKDISAFLDLYSYLPDAIAKYNEDFIEKEKKRCDNLLSNIDGKSLDDQQREVVVSDEDHSLVLAGAGSGKTLTIAGKVKYLCEEKKVDPADILLISYTNKAADEMESRIRQLGIPVKATTMHKLGKNIITEMCGECLDVCNEDELKKFINNYFKSDLLKDPNQLKLLVEFFAYYFNIPPELENCSSLGEYIDKTRYADFETIKAKYESKSEYIASESEKNMTSKRTLKNEKVKSIEEVTIANFLFLNGIEYVYEKEYPYPSPDKSYRKYKPDFYLPEYNLYIEHFGINKDGHAPWLSNEEEQRYLKGIEWKREFHYFHHTALIETYSYFSTEGRLLEELSKQLEINGVIFKQRDFKDVFDTIYNNANEDKFYREFINLCSSFVSLFKSRGYHPNEILKLEYQTAKYKQSTFFKNRLDLFKRIIYPILVRYSYFLKLTNAVDFSDMITQAADYVNSRGDKIHKYKYIIIDEYQDISFARYKLVKEILDKTKAKLLCVGDDWQSIFRYAGSDISLFVDFEKYFGYSRIMRLGKTYRNSQQLADELGLFI